MKATDKAFFRLDPALVADLVSALLAALASRVCLPGDNRAVGEEAASSSDELMHSIKDGTLLSSLSDKPTSSATLDAAEAGGLAGLIGALR